MNPEDPESAQRIVADYARVLERNLGGGTWPATADTLPYPKMTIKSAIRTSLTTLAALGQLTDELRAFLEDAYVSLADYVSADLAQLMAEYQRAGEALAADHRLAREKTTDIAWQTVAHSGALAGRIARSIAEDAASLKNEYRSFGL